MPQTRRQLQMRPINANLQRDLDEQFKPLFSEYEDNMPMSTLYENLKHCDLPREQVSDLVKSADVDGDKIITYHEFCQRMKSVDSQTFKKLSKPKRFLNMAVYAVDPSLKHVPITYTGDQPDFPWGEDEAIDNYVKAYDCCPPPIFIPFITIVQIVIFIVYYVKLNSNDDPYDDVTFSKGVDMTSPLIYNPNRRSEAWRFFTYGLMHAGWNHLIFNLIVQVILGTLLELVHKFIRVAIVYCVGVIFGSLCHSVFDSTVYLAGASGGVYALIGAQFAVILMNWSELQRGWLDDPVKFFSSGVFRLVVFSILGGGDTAMAIYERFTIDSNSRVGFAAHAGGFIAGILVGVACLRNMNVKPWEKYCLYICIVLAVLFFTFCVAFNVACAGLHMCCPVDLADDLIASCSK